MNYYTVKEVQKHNKKTDCWLISNYKVYDVTKFIDNHPIGSNPIIVKAGLDCTEDYDFHDKKSRKIWESYHIGYISREPKCSIL